MTDAPKVKTCSKCGEVKSTSEFSKRGSGLQSLCKTCSKRYIQRYYQENREKINEYERRYYQENPEKVKEYKRRYRQKNREKINEYERRCYQENPNRVKDSQLRYRYNLTVVQYFTKLDSQNRQCETCYRTLTVDRSSTGACLDHDHKTGKVRDFLCNRCNHLEGLLVKQHDDTLTLEQRLRNMYEYIKHHEKA